MAFRGTYEHTVDDRGRVAVPARYRHLFSEGAILVLNPEGAVEVYTVEGYESQAQLIRAEPATHLKGRQLRLAFFARSWDTELDRQGRILIPQYLREKAGLTGPVVIAGRDECLQIWSQERWEDVMAQVEAAYPEQLESLE